MNSRFLALALVAIAGSAARAQTFTNVNYSFNEPAFPTALTTLVAASTVAPPTPTSASYNILDDVTGAKLLALSGDQPDLLGSFLASGRLGKSTAGSPSVEWQTASTGRFTLNKGYTGAVTTSNPGTLTWVQTRLMFASHVTITDLSAVFSSLNTAGIAWEYSTVAFLRPDGSYFSAAPTIGSYAGFGGLTGSPSQGWFVAADKTTVTGVGTALTASGSAGAADGSAFTLGYGQVGLASGTQIGGIELTSYLEDVRGTSNASTNFTASLLDITVSGSLAAPEPGTLLLFLPVLVLIRRRRLPKS
jgi:hypothetical protein